MSLARTNLDPILDPVLRVVVLGFCGAPALFVLRQLGLRRHGARAGADARASAFGAEAQTALSPRCSKVADNYDLQRTPLPLLKNSGKLYSGKPL